MEEIYNNYFKDHPFPSLVLKPENGSRYIIHDVNESFLTAVQVRKSDLVNKDLFEAFLNNAHNKSSISASIVKTSLAFVKTFRTPRKLERLPFTYYKEGEANLKLWEIFNYPIIDKEDNLKYIIHVSRDIPKEEYDKNRTSHPPDNDKKVFEKLQFVQVIDDFNEVLKSRGKMEDVLEKAFSVIGEALSVERMYFYKNSKDDESKEESTSLYIEWAKNSSWETLKCSKNQEVPFEDWKEMIIPLAHRIEFKKNIRDIKNLRLKESLIAKGIKGLYALPIFVSNQFYGFIAMDECMEEREWSKKEQDFFKCIAALISAEIESSLENRNN